MSGIATAVIGGAVIGGYLQGEATTEAAETAAGAQERGAALGIEEQRRQFDQLQALLAPYVAGGETAFTAQQNLIGLGGPEEQEKAIAALEGSPQFEAITRQGEEAILAGASATGGLRGGDVQGTLAQFRPQVLSQMIESQYNKLGGIAQVGQASAAGVGAAGMGSAGEISRLLSQSGDAQAQAALLSGQAKANMYGNVASSFGTVAGMSKGSFGKF